MTLTTPNWMQNNSYSAQRDRQLIGGLVLGEGVDRPTAMKVSAATGLTVNIAKGGGFVKGDNSVDQGVYYVYNDATFNLTGFTLPSSGNTKYDYVALRINDTQAGGGGGNNAQFVVVNGNGGQVTIGQIPTPPTLGASEIPLAQVQLTAGQGSIVAANIVSKRWLAPGIDHIGSVKPWFGTLDEGSILPFGHMALLGQEISRVTFADLFEIFGVIHGDGDGANTFNLPDSTGRFLAGAGTAAGSSLAKVLGAPGGQESFSIQGTNLPAHAHTMNHDHANTSPALNGGVLDSNISFNGSIGFGLGDAGSLRPVTRTVTVDTPSYSGSTGNGPGTGASIQHVPAYIACNWIVRAL